MDLYGSAGISQSNGYNMANAEAEREINEGNSNIDDNIRKLSQAKTTAKGLVQEKTDTGLSEAGGGQALDVYGLNKVRQGFKAGKEALKAEKAVKLKALIGGAGAGDMSLESITRNQPAPETPETPSLNEGSGAIEAGGDADDDIGAVVDFGENVANRIPPPGLSSTVESGASEVAQTASDAVGLGAEGSRVADVVGGGADALVEGGAKSALKAGLSTTAKTFGGVGAVVGGGLAIEDLLNKKPKNEFDKWGDYLSIGGSTAELAGLATTAIPGVGLGLDVLGGLTSIAGGVLGEIGKEEDKGKKDKSIDVASAKEKATLQSEKQSTQPAGASSAGAGAVASGGYSSSKSIQGSGSF